MRIIGGKFKGKYLYPGKEFRSRPTTDFSKESLFNILENRIDWENSSALDLFAGTGSISFELVSRGCKMVTAVEKDFYHCRFIRKTQKELKIENLEVINRDVFRYLSKHPGSFDLIFADPPYDAPWFETVAEKTISSGVVKPGGLFILEHSKSHRFETTPAFLELRQYGSVFFSFFVPSKQQMESL